MGVWETIGGRMGRLLTCIHEDHRGAAGRTVACRPADGAARGDDRKVAPRGRPQAGPGQAPRHHRSEPSRRERRRKRPAPRVPRRQLGRDPQRGLRGPPVIALDTNILVYSHRRDSEFHRAAAAKVRELAEGRAPWALPWPCLHEFFSIVTHSRIYDPPSRADLAIDQIDAWLETASAVLLSEGDMY